MSAHTPRQGETVTKPSNYIVRLTNRARKKAKIVPQFIKHKNRGREEVHLISDFMGYFFYISVRLHENCIFLKNRYSVSSFHFNKSVFLYKKVILFRISSTPNSSMCPISLTF